MQILHHSGDGRESTRYVEMRVNIYADEIHHLIKREREKRTVFLGNGGHIIVSFTLFA